MMTNYFFQTKRLKFACLCFCFLTVQEFLSVYRHPPPEWGRGSLRTSGPRPPPLPHWWQTSWFSGSTWPPLQNQNQNDFYDLKMNWITYSLLAATRSSDEGSGCWKSNGSRRTGPWKWQVKPLIYFHK